MSVRKTAEEAQNQLCFEVFENKRSESIKDTIECWYHYDDILLLNHRVLFNLNKYRKAAIKA